MQIRRAELVLNTRYGEAGGDIKILMHRFVSYSCFELADLRSMSIS